MTLSDANKGINCAYEDGGSIDPLSMLQFEKKAWTASANPKGILESSASKSWGKSL